MRLKKFFSFLLFSSIFISCCTVALCIQTNLVLGLPLNPLNFYIFVFGATMAQYNLHYVSKTIAVKGSLRFAWTRRHRKLHFVLLGIGIAMVLYSLFGFSLYHYWILILLGIIAFFYSFPFLFFGKRIKDYGVLKIFTLVLLWTLVTVWFPVNRVTYDAALFALVFCERFVFMFILCLLFDMRDAPVDKAGGIHTLGVLLKRKQVRLVAYFSLLLLLVLSIIEFYFFANNSVLFAMLLSLIFTFWVIQATKSNDSDILYLAGIDGMMLLQPLLVGLFSIIL